MLWGLLILAALLGFLIEVACYALRIRNFPVILILQFLASLSAMYGLIYFISGNSQLETSMWGVCLGVSVAIAVLNLLVRHYLGSWSSRRPGSGVK